MKLRKVISGGQSGADRAGLEAAEHRGLETGGTAPKGYRTEYGPDFALRDRFHLTESAYDSYPPRTKQNVRDADCTVWFGRCNSPGYLCTRRAADALGKPFFENPSAEEMAALALEYEVINVAGNRFSGNPSVVQTVAVAFGGIR